METIQELVHSFCKDSEKSDDWTRAARLFISSGISFETATANEKDIIVKSILEIFLSSKTELKGLILSAELLKIVLREQNPHSFVRPELLARTIALALSRMTLSKTRTELFSYDKWEELQKSEANAKDNALFKDASSFFGLAVNLLATCDGYTRLFYSGSSVDDNPHFCDFCDYIVSCEKLTESELSLMLRCVHIVAAKEYAIITRNDKEHCTSKLIDLLICSRELSSGDAERAVCSILLLTQHIGILNGLERHNIIPTEKETDNFKRYAKHCIHWFLSLSIGTTLRKAIVRSLTSAPSDWCLSLGDSEGDLDEEKKFLFSLCQEFDLALSETISTHNSEATIPFVVLVIELCKSTTAQQILHGIIFDQPFDKADDNSFVAKITKCILSSNETLKITTEEMVFNLCNKNMSEVIRCIGLGAAAALMQRHLANESAPECSQM